MFIGAAAYEKTGMPELHGTGFQIVANQTGCVISSRAVGKYVTGLLLEGYATKGFHNKAKSCNWGPMAGFVLADPRFTKRGSSLDARMDQRKDLKGSIQHGGSEIPLLITDARRRALESKADLGCIVAATDSRGNSVNTRHYWASSTTGDKMLFVLERVMDGPGANGKQLWAVKYGPNEVRMSNNLTAPNKAAGGALLPVMAMVDAACPTPVRKTYRGATTGDYDLFAIFVNRSDYERKGMDARMVPGSDRFKLGIKTYIQHEDKHLGNLTARIGMIRDMLNGRIQSMGYTGGHCVHHSDEAGRPFVTEMDLPFIAFIPGEKQPYCADSIADFKELLVKLGTKYVASFNAGWYRQLGMSVTPKGSYEV